MTLDETDRLDAIDRAIDGAFIEEDAYFRLIYLEKLWLLK